MNLTSLLTKASGKARLAVILACGAAAISAAGLAAPPAGFLTALPDVAARQSAPPARTADGTHSDVEGGSGTQSRQSLEAELVTLSPAGFEPAEVVRAGGPFLLAVNNRSGAEGLTLLLVRQNGAREREVRLRGRMRWRERVNLPPGDYTLSVAGHPEWVCRLSIN